MARTGVYKWDVKDARDQLVKEGKNPSIDAVRAALGNTGSKSTIHRFMKELEAEESGASSAAISEALQTLVAQLAERLKHESEVELLAATERFDADRAALRLQLGQAQEEGQRVRSQLERVVVTLGAEKEEHALTGNALQIERTKGVQLGEQVHGLEQRLAEQLTYRQSLEEKHEHARQALEHFRAAAKEQRDQEQRRHEQQVAQLQADVRALNGSLTEKLSQIAQLSRDAAALSAENGNLRSQVQEVRAEKERVEREALRARDAASQGEGQRLAMEGQLRETKAALADQASRGAADAQRIRELELSAARTDVQMEQVRGQLASIDREYRWLAKLASVAGIVGSADAIEKMSAEAKRRFDGLRKEAQRVFETEDAAELWICQRCPALGGTAPLNLIETDQGLEEATRELARIEHGLSA